MALPRRRRSVLTLAHLTVAVFALALAACAPARRAEAPLTHSPGAPLPTLHHEDVLWLERLGFGLDSQLLADYRRLGREGLLEQQLAVRDDALPSAVAAEVNALPIARSDPRELLAELRAQTQSIDAMPVAQRAQAHMALNQSGNELARQAISRELLRAIYSPAQLREQMVWFWLNHFSVYQNKDRLRWLVGDYEERAIRPHALGHFKDLLLATLEHPAMLQYLDNQQNRAGHVNENYAREFMELHTLGVDAGYTQQDVQQLALIFTGVGINLGPPARLNRSLQRLYLRRGAFEFNPAHHDGSEKRLFGYRVTGRGFQEVQNAVNLIVRQRACARFISRQLAIYFVADEPPPTLVAKMSQTFQHTDGDIAAVLRTMFLAPEFDAALGGKFKDPMRFVVSAVRLAYEGHTIVDTGPLINWLRLLGELPYGHQTPDGYALTESSWASPGQLSSRFEVARTIGSGNARLFSPDSGDSAALGGFAQLSNPLYFETLEPYLATNTHAVLERASSPSEWSTLVLASPEFNYE